MSSLCQWPVGVELRLATGAMGLDPWPMTVEAHRGGAPEPQAPRRPYAIAGGGGIVAVEP